MAELALHSNRVITNGKIVDATIFIKNGIISEIVNGLPENYSGEIIDVGNKIIMPGIIDPHVHINEPGRTEWEGFDTATKAAIAGGVTTLIDMPLNASPVTTTAKAFDEKVSSTKNKLHTNCGFWGGIVPGNEDEIERLIDKGVFGFKAFLTHSGIDEFPNVTEEDLRKVMPIIARNKLPLLVHCELDSFESGVITNSISYKNYLASRPKKWEDDAIALMIRLCEEYNCRVHIVHLSSANSIEQIAKAKQKKLLLTVETGQHYLFFNAEEIPNGATAFKCAPPIREKENNDLLWQALKDGIIDFVATDHSPATPDIKEIKSGNFMKAWGGIASLQFALPALWTAAKERKVSVQDIAKWLSENPAKLIGREHNIGKIAPGYDADIIVWDDKKECVITEKIIQHKNKITPYLDKTLRGVIEQTYLGGVEVYKNGKFSALNNGKFIIHIN
ncbi:MAG: allantoinase AllB [Ginsengibacter sp.]